MIAWQQFKSTLRTSWRILLKELSAFGIVGALNFILDIAIFQFLIAYVGADPLLSKVISTVTTTTTAYFMHRHWSFSHRARTGIGREYGLFFVLNGITLLMSLLIIGLVRYPLGRTDTLALQLANITSIGIGTIFRFWSYKRWVFPPEMRPDVESFVAEGSLAAEESLAAETSARTADIDGESRRAL